MQVDVWSDVVCPWCYIGKRNLEAALARFPHAADVRVVYHSFELDPTAPKESTATLAEVLGTKYGASPSQVVQMQERVTGAAASVGLEFHLDQARPENTLDAHRLLHFAHAKGLQAEMKEVLMRAYFTQGRRIAGTDALVALAVEAGLDADETRAALADSTYTADVRADQARARELGVRGVPFFVLEQRYGVSGAQPADALLAALERAWAERPVDVADAEGCGPEVCAVPKQDV